MTRTFDAAFHGTSAPPAPSHDYHYQIGATVAIRTDEAPIPHLGVIKKVNPKTQLYDILWLYRSRDCGKPPPKQQLRNPCSYEFTEPGNAEPVRVTDPGDLKEIFFSAHAGEIKPGTIIHEVQVLYLPSAGSNLDPSTLERLQLLPGLICRHLVDISDWSFHQLKPSLLEDPADGALLSGLLQSSDKRLKRIVSDMSHSREAARPEAERLHGKGSRG